ncbi:cytochrome c [Candidatus Gracilibacteria bacterium]|nr:cytochrome c [Candidatus Gracilibacteria bacterium]
MDRARMQHVFTRFSRYSWVALCLLLVACHTDMYSQPKYQPNDPSEFFEDGRANRPPVPNTVALGNYEADPAFLTGVDAAGELVSELPIELTMDLVQVGQVRYNSYCMPCHGLVGDGNGIIAQRGPIVVPSFHTDRLRSIQVGYLYDVITNGVGRMYSYGARVEPADRWAIVAYMRSLQLSQNGNFDDLTPEQQQSLESAGGQ